MSVGPEVSGIALVGVGVLGAVVGTGGIAGTGVSGALVGEAVTGSTVSTVAFAVGAMVTGTTLGLGVFALEDGTGVREPVTEATEHALAQRRG